MQGRTYDVVIVGARCAGAALATLLSGEGASVLLLDKDTLPSDQVLSTHTIHPPGIEILDELGVGAAVREIAPANRVMRLNKNRAVVDIEFPAGREEYCPRRMRLDDLMQKAAVGAGAVLLDKTRVTSLIWENGRAAGVRACCGGVETEFRAGLVVGADGRHSSVARLVQAEEYLGYDSPRAMFWGYWNAPDFWKKDPAFGMYVGHLDGEIRVIFRTDHHQLLIGSLPPVNQTPPWRAAPLQALKANLVKDPTIAPLVGDRDPDGKVRCTIHERFYFRQGTGPGWVLVGDAGHHKEFVIGDGITEGLLQARRLAVAIRAGTDQALARWWRERDVHALPYFFFGQDEGAIRPPRRLQSLAFSQMAGNPGLKARLVRVLEHQLSPYEMLPPEKVFGWMLGGLLRGDWRLLPDFLAMGRRMSRVKKEVNAAKERMI